MLGGILTKNTSAYQKENGNYTIKLLTYHHEDGEPSAT